MSSKQNIKEVKKGCFILVLIALAAMLILNYTCENKKLSKEEVRFNLINKLLYKSGANTVSLKIRYMIEKDLNDPKSMNPVELTYIDKDTIIVITQQFTAKNAFGGTLKKEVIVTIDTLGNIIEVNKWFK